MAAPRASARGRLAPLSVEDGAGELCEEDGILALKEVEKLDIGAMALETAKQVVKHRPVLLSFWAFGLLIAAFAGGLPVDATAEEAYSLMRQQAEVVESRELGKALLRLQQEEDAYYNVRGWFGACDDVCMKAHDKFQMARAEVGRLREHHDRVLSKARREVGIWSSFGVQDVRRSFWDAWKSGKEFAARMTMWDALFLSMGGGRDKSFAMLAIQVIVQYLLNLTMGLIGAFFFFVHNVYCLVVSYGESALSGLAFLLLAVVAGLATVGTYLCALYGAAVGGGLMVMRQAALQALAAQPGSAHGKLQHSPCPSPRRRQ